MTDPKANILLVDDRRENLLALEATLASLDENLVLAHSGEEALTCLLKQQFAVVLLDVQMPGMDGFELAHLMRQREKSKHTPIIFLTAIEKSDTFVSKAYSLGAVDYLFKPFEPEILRAKVQVFVDLFKLRQQVIRQREEQQERELHSFERLSGPPPTTATAQTFGLAPLSKSVPDRFDEWVQQYGDLMDLALEQRSFSPCYSWRRHRQCRNECWKLARLDCEALRV